MRKFGFLLILSNLCLCVSLRADNIADADFSSGSNGLNGWTQLGAPSASGGIATITSTDAEHYTGSPDAPGSDTASDIEAKLGVTLPNTDLDAFSPTDGQAIFQEFTLSSSSEVTFTYSSSSTDASTFDGVGYSIINVADPTSGIYTPLLNSAGPTSVASAEKAPGTYILGFVAYNTNDNQYSTTLNVSDLEPAEVPEPSTYLLLACGFGLLLFRSRRARCVAVVTSGSTALTGRR